MEVFNFQSASGYRVLRWNTCAWYRGEFLEELNVSVVQFHATDIQRASRIDRPRPRRPCIPGQTRHHNVVRLTLIDQSGHGFTILGLSSRIAPRVFLLKALSVASNLPNNLPSVLNSRLRSRPN
jgi:hypothetical protein